MAFLFERITAFFISLVIAITNLFGISESPFTEKVEDFRVTSYIVAKYVQSEENLHPEDFDIITDAIVFGCATFNAEGEVVVEEDTIEVALRNIRKAIGDRDVHLTLNLLGPSGTTDSTVWEEQMEVMSEEHNKAFTSGVLEDNIIAVLDKYNFDGVHFDYEYPLSQKAWNYYNDFLVSLDEKLGDYTLGVAASDWNLKFSHKAVEAVDTFEIMLYDFLDDEGRHSTYEGMAELLPKAGLYGIPLEKINAGLPFYARPSDLDAYWYDYIGYHSAIGEDGWYHCPDINKDFWFNTPDVTEQKTDFTIRNGFGGVMIWHYTCDLPSSNPKSLLGAVGRAVDNNY